MDDRPIGVFDSGLGGLTVVRALVDLLPGEDLVYIGDSARYPYGPKPLEAVRGFALELTHHLVAVEGVKAVVMACNTATAAALEEVRAMVDVPVVGVIEPGVRSVLAATQWGRVGVIGTVGTIGSGAYQRAVHHLRPDVELTCAACPGFVEFVERGETDTDQARILAERLLAPVRDAKVDALLLGCTHYPFLARTIGDVMGRDVLLVSSAEETAFEVRRALEDPSAPSGSGRDAGGRRKLLTTGDLAAFQRMGARLLGGEVAEAAVVRVPAGGPPIRGGAHPS